MREGSVHPRTSKLLLSREGDADGPPMDDGSRGSMLEGGPTPGSISPARWSAALHLHSSSSVHIHHSVTMCFAHVKAHFHEVEKKSSLSFCFRFTL